MSPDGRNAYVAAETSGSVAVLARDDSTGALTPLAGTVGRVSKAGIGGVCVDGTALSQPRGVAVSPDGANV